MTEAIGSKNVLTVLNSMINDVKGSSVQFQFAMLQLEQSAQCKTQAEDYMKQIESIQEEQKKVADMISQARKLQDQAKTNKGCSTMPQEMVDFFKDRGLAWDTTGKDTLHNKDEWDVNIKSLTNYQEQVGNKTQTLMVYLQDFIGQYNSYLEGAKSSIDKGVSTLSTINQAVR